MLSIHLFCSFITALKFVMLSPFYLGVVTYFFTKLVVTVCHVVLCCVIRSPLPLEARMI